MINQLRLTVAQKSDSIAVVLAAVILLGGSLLSHPSLREFSSVLSVVCLLGLLWRVIGTLREMDVLSVALSISLMLNLGTASVAQYLLSRSIDHFPAGGPQPPSNTFGILLVMASRLFILWMIVRWDRYLMKQRA